MTKATRARKNSVSGLALPARPILYEINTWVWLHDLSIHHGRDVRLGDVPAAAWDGVAAAAPDAVWLMGVWERSPAGIEIATRNPGLMDSFRAALSDLSPADIAGSPYCVRRYVVDERLGGPEGLAAARAELAKRGIALVLDFVPNHVAPDHPWTLAQPDYFIRGDDDDLRRAPAEFLRAGSHILANGRDPYFAPWPDVAQLNAFHPGLRAATIETLIDLGGQCDGLRVDMAMLMTTAVFEQTWGTRAGARPAAEYWHEIIPAVRAARPHLSLIAEVYWDMEATMQAQGFDYCYDKTLYDRLEKETAESVRTHLHADVAYQERLVRFIENHDEARAAAAFPAAKDRAAAVVAYTLPGARLFHEGQFEGRRVKLPVFLGRRPAEPVDAETQTFYARLLAALRDPALRDGQWRPCVTIGWPDNQSHVNLVTWGYRAGDERRLVVVNLSDVRSQARIQPAWPDLAGQSWLAHDQLALTDYSWDGDEIMNIGVYVDLPAWGYHLFVVK